MSHSSVPETVKVRGLSCGSDHNAAVAVGAVRQTANGVCAKLGQAHRLQATAGIIGGDCSDQALGKKRGLDIPVKL